jgi:hypothetical protein
MKTPVLGISAAAIAALPVHVLLIVSAGTTGLIMLIYIGIALPAVWSANLARRRAAVAVLRLILGTSTHPGPRQRSHKKPTGTTALVGTPHRHHRA